jgi:hypothetical protein
MARKLTAYRQGDILLIKRNRSIIPETATIKATKIVAEGEGHGHQHAFADTAPVTIYSTGSPLLQYAIVQQPSLLEHQEHESYTIPAGTYEIRRQREATLEDTERAVMD